MPTKSKRRAWTTEHVRTLKTLAKKKTHAARIAKTLKRSEGATRQKAFSLGLSLDFKGLNQVQRSFDSQGLMSTESPAKCGAFFVEPLLLP